MLSISVFQENLDGLSPDNSKRDPLRAFPYLVERVSSAVNNSDFQELCADNDFLSESIAQSVNPIQRIRPQRLKRKL